MIYNNLKKFIKKFPTFWNFLTRFKDRLINLSRLKDVLMMMLLLNVWPEQTYRFSTRKLLPSKKNRLPKKAEPVIPYDLLKHKCSNIPMMKEINIIGRGSSFDLNKIKDITGPIFLVAFWSPLKLDNNGKIFYKHWFSYEKGSFEEKSEQKNKGENRDEYFSKQTEGSDYINKNITYATGRIKVMEMLKKRGHNILAIKSTTIAKDGKYCAIPTSDLHLIDNDQCKQIILEEKVYRYPMLDSQPNWAPTGSFLPNLCGLSFFAKKINVYGWDTLLDSSPEKMGYWKLLFNMYKYGADVLKWNAHFEHALINFYYGYQFSKLPNVNIYGYMGQLGKHDKLIKRIEKVLFN